MSSLEQALQNYPELQSHLKGIFNDLLTQTPNKAYDQFEDISIQVKNKEKVKKSLNKQVSELQQLIGKNQVEGEEQQEIGVIGYVPNFIDESKLFQYAGIYFGEEETYIIQKSLQKLCQQKQTKQLRLWGKILCSNKDYYVVEGISDGDAEGELPPNVEPKGTGINKFTYFVTNSLLSDWQELPLCYPEHIIAARHIKYIFTENAVITNPHFPGKEKNLLRAQIARISFSTQIVPLGIYKLNDDDQKEIELIEQDETWKAPQHKELSKIQNWAHLTQNILKEGRLAHMKPENIPEDQDEEQVMIKIQQNDPFEQRLKPLSNDKSQEGLQQSWVLQLKGDNTEYQNLNNPQQIKNQSKLNIQGLIVLKSLIWKGFCHIYQAQFPKDQFIANPYSQRFQNSIYVGYGFKSDQNLFYPKFPQVLQEEPDGLKEEDEPRYNQVEQKEEVKDEE